jgi:hypothetical protein
VDINVSFDGTGDLFGPVPPKPVHIPPWLVQWLARRSEHHDSLRAFAGGSLSRRNLIAAIVNLLAVDGVAFHERSVPQQALIAQAETLANGASELAEAYNLVFLAMPEIVLTLIERHADGPTRAAVMSGYMMKQAPVWPFSVARPKAA